MFDHDIPSYIYIYTACNIMAYARLGGIVPDKDRGEESCLDLLPHHSYLYTSLNKVSIIIFTMSI